MINEQIQPRTNEPGFLTQRKTQKEYNQYQYSIKYSGSPRSERNSKENSNFIE